MPPNEVYGAVRRPIPAPPDFDDEVRFVGPCCACRREDVRLRNVVCMAFRPPESALGKGWGCVVCAIPADGALALVCDECMAAERPIVDVCAGYLAVPVAGRGGCRAGPARNPRSRREQADRPPPAPRVGMAAAAGGRAGGVVIVDLFAGPGGWSEGLRELGLRDAGIEVDRWACATRAAAGHQTIRADVATYPTEPFRGRVEGLIASPPCPDFSRAGKRRGLAGKTGWLTHEVMRWAEALRPLWLACEQVPDVLPIWREFAWRLRQLGYSTWAGILCAADYGVPQTRERAFLLAHRERAALPPEPTHCRGGREAGLFVPALEPWVSMAEALGWGGRLETENRSEVAGGHVDYLRDTARPAPCVVSNADRWTLHTNRDQRPNGDRQTVAVDRPAPAVTGKSGGQWALRSGQSIEGSGRAVRDLSEPAVTVTSSVDDCRWTFVNGNQAHAARGEPHEPAPTIHFGHNLNECTCVAERPATTVCATPRIGRPGHKDRDQGEQQFAEQSVRVSVREAAILQGFRPDYPWQGTKTAQFSQVGNAVPPPMAEAIIRALRGQSDHARRISGEDLGWEMDGEEPDDDA